MPDWHTPLAIATALFGLFILWRFRPSFSRDGRGPMRGGLRKAHAKLEAAKDDEARAQALADLGDASMRGVGGASRAIGFYARAMRARPRSAELVERAARAFVQRPRALETLLWRRLGADPWKAENREATRVALRHLAHLYSGPLRNAARARAIENALHALEDVGGA
jgi:hypothetical protein